MACGNIVPGVRSLYWWKGEICDDGEELLIMETDSDNIDAKISRIAALHAYEVPKILAVEPTEGLPAYLAWAAKHTGAVEAAAWWVRLIDAPRAAHHSTILQPPRVALGVTPASPRRGAAVRPSCRCTEAVGRDRGHGADRR